MKSCPFCGEEATVYLKQDYSGVKVWSVSCDSENCLLDCVWATGFNTEEDAVKAWNTRSEK